LELHLSTAGFKSEGTRISLIGGSQCFVATRSKSSPILDLCTHPEQVIRDPIRWWPSIRPLQNVGTPLCVKRERETEICECSSRGGSDLDGGGGGLSVMARGTRRAPDPPPKPSPSSPAGQRDLLRAGIMPNSHPPPALYMCSFEVTGPIVLGHWFSFC
jgi:hypothetical protein